MTRRTRCARGPRLCWRRSTPARGGRGPARGPGPGGDGATSRTKKADASGRRAIATTTSFRRGRFPDSPRAGSRVGIYLGSRPSRTRRAPGGFRRLCRARGSRGRRSRTILAGVFAQPRRRRFGRRRRRPARRRGDGRALGVVRRRRGRRGVRRVGGGGVVGTRRGVGGGVGGARRLRRRDGPRRGGHEEPPRRPRARRQLRRGGVRRGNKALEGAGARARGAAAHDEAPLRSLTWRSALVDPPRRVRRLVPAPRGPLCAAADSLGRVTVLSAAAPASLTATRHIKGCRDAEVAWVEAPPPRGSHARVAEAAAAGLGPCASPCGPGPERSAVELWDVAGCREGDRRGSSRGGEGGRERRGGGRERRGGGRERRGSAVAEADGFEASGGSRGAVRLLQAARRSDWPAPGRRARRQRAGGRGGAVLPPRRRRNAPRGERASEMRTGFRFSLPDLRAVRKRESTFRHVRR